MTKGKLAILIPSLLFILTLVALIGPARSDWAQRVPSPTPTNPPTTRVPEPATGLLLLTGLAGLAIRQLRK